MCIFKRSFGGLPGLASLGGMSYLAKLKLLGSYSTVWVFSTSERSVLTAFLQHLNHKSMTSIHVSKVDLKWPAFTSWVKMIHNLLYEEFYDG